MSLSLWVIFAEGWQKPPELTELFCHTIREHNNKKNMKQRIAFACIMGIITTGLISFTLISFNTGFTDAFAGTWLRSWCMAYAVAIPAILIPGPKVQILVNRLFK